MIGFLVRLGVVPVCPQNLIAPVGKRLCAERSGLGQSDLIGPIRASRLKVTNRPTRPTGEEMTKFLNGRATGGKLVGAGRSVMARVLSALMMVMLAATLWLAPSDPAQAAVTDCPSIVANQQLGLNFVRDNCAEVDRWPNPRRLGVRWTISSLLNSFPTARRISRFRIFLPIPIRVF